MRVAYLTDLLTVRLGGRAAELVVFGQGSTGAANDLATATQMATRMVTEFGLSPALGPVGYGSGEAKYLRGATDPLARKPFSEQTQHSVDGGVVLDALRAENGQGVVTVAPKNAKPPARKTV